MTGRDRIKDRLRWYGPVEMLNAALLPAFMAGWCWFEGQAIGWLFVLTCVPMCLLLLLGGQYWRVKLLQLEGNGAAMRRFLPLADRCQPVMFALCAIALIAAMLSWLDIGIGKSLGERIAASIAATLAALEYVNYYHRQLQHFDHAPDFKRLLAGKGFRPSQMAVDLARWKDAGAK
jgi:hypothetical protein